MATETKTSAVVITGAGRGIGFAFAQRLARDGYTVVLADLHGAEEAASRIRDSGGQALGYQLNVAEAADWDALLADLQARNLRIWGLVNNAAFYASLQLQTFDKVPKSEWMQVMEVNTYGPFLGAQKVVPLMAAQGGGSIVNVASTSPLKGVTGMPHYTSSKSALIGLTRSLARELGNRSIRVNAIAPGLTLSDGILTNTDHVERFRELSKNSRAIQRDQQPEDLEGALAFLLSPDASFITGQTLVVDGGAHFV